MPVDYAARTIEALARFGEVTRIKTIAEAPEAGHCVYAVLNGEAVLQIGKGSFARMRSCMRGSLAQRHNKAFICAVGEKVLGRPNEYAFVALRAQGEQERKALLSEVEASVHTSLGIQTNANAACLIPGLSDDRPISVVEVNRWLWGRMVELPEYRRLSDGAKAMAEELFDLVTWAVVRERGGGRPDRQTRQGDLLEGHMLRITGMAHLIHVFEALTDGYLRYESHRISDEAYRDMEADYNYTPRGAPFTIEVRREEGDDHVGDRREATAPARRRFVAPLPPQPPVGLQHVGAGTASPPGTRRLTQKTRLLFRRDELEDLGPEDWVEFNIFNEGTKSDPRRIDVTVRCQVGDILSRFDPDRDADWNDNRKHSWSKFPNWAHAWILNGQITG